MKLSVAVARAAALALNEAADRAMADGAHEFEFDNVALHTSAKFDWFDLAEAIEATITPLPDSFVVSSAVNKGD